jgi:NTE family protein
LPHLETPGGRIGGPDRERDPGGLTAIMTATARTPGDREPRRRGGQQTAGGALIGSTAWSANGGKRARGGSRGPRPYTAFVLSGGASLGALQVGMLRALYERGIVPDLLVGTSAGALNAAFVCSRPQTAASAEELARIWRGLQREDVFPVSARGLIGGVTSHRDHLFSDRGLRDLARRHLQIERLEEAPVPLHLIAVDLLSGEEVRLSHGPAIDAILAASAIPGLLPPVRWGDLMLIDGGVVNNTPISHAVELGAERIYVLPTTDGSHPLPAPPRGAIDTAVHGLSLLVGARLESDLARYGADVELIVLPAANSHHVQPTDFDHSSRLIGDGLAAARAALGRNVTRRRAAA